MTDTNNFAIRVLLVVCAVAILILLILQFNKKNSKVVGEEKYIKESYENLIQNDNKMDATIAPMQNNIPPPSIPIKNENIQHTENTVMASEPDSNEDFKAVDYETTKNMPNECYPRDKLTAEDLLPKDAANSKWSEANPSGQGDVSDRNFLSAGFHIGTDTVGQSLRNPNYQLRSDPPNPQVKVGPWNQSTIEFDQSRKHFEINEC